MSDFLNILMTASGSSTLPPQDTSPLRLLNLGDSISRGTSDGVGNATDGRLFEWDGAALNQINNDVEDALTGSPYPSMADELFSLTGRILHVVNTGIGGAEFSPNGNNNNWSASGDNYGLMITKSDSYTTSVSDTFDIIRITLGINDARGTANLATISLDTISLIDRLIVSFPGIPIIINQLGKSTASQPRVDSVRADIDNLVSTYANVFAAKDLNDYPIEDYFDGLHLDQAGNDQLGIDDSNIINTII